MSIAKWLLAKKLSGGGSPFPPVIKRVTGNPIEITDGADAPMVKCVTEIQGSQDLHGYDKPWVGGAGKNKIDESSVSLYDVTGQSTYRVGLAPVTLPAGTYTFSYTLGPNYNSFYMTNITDGYTQTKIENNPYTFSISGTKELLFRTTSSNVNDFDTTNIQLESGSTPTTYSPYSNICPITAYTEGEIEVRGRNLCNQADKTTSGSGYVIGTNAPDYINTDHTVFPAGTYTFSFNVSGASSGSQAQAIFYRDDSHPVGTKTGSVGTAGRKPYTITATVPFAKMQLYCNSSSGGQFTDFQLERGDTLHDYEEYIAPITHTTTFPSAIYRGSEDVVNGTVGAGSDGKLWHKFVFDGTDNSGWNLQAHYGTVSRFNYDGTSVNVKPGGDIIANYFNKIGIGTQDTMGINTHGSYPLIIIQIETSLLATDNVAGLMGYFSSHNLEVACEVTPTTTSVTPTNLPIRTLSGYNHIESSTGDMVIDYITDQYQNFVDTVENALPNTRKSGPKAMDVFLSLEKKDDDKAEAEKEAVKEEVK